MNWWLVLAVLVALGVGIWLGMPGKYDRNLDELDERLSESGKSRRKVKRHLIFIDMLRKSQRGSQRRRGRTPFKND